MTPAQFAFLRGFLRERSGLALTIEKRYLVDSRLMPLCRRRKLPSLSDLVARLELKCDPELERLVVEAMTTNETFFFRDRAPFDIFRDALLPQVMRARADTKRLRIWCAAASSGQEPYSLAMHLKEVMPSLRGWRVEIVATDLSAEMIERAKTGLYTQFEVQRGLPVGLLLKHFDQVGEMWRIASDIRAMVQFRTLNLLRDFATLGTFDVIYCRNVMIYFDPVTKINVMRRLAARLAADGALALGAAETVIGLADEFVPHPDCCGFYAPRPLPRAPLALVANGGAARAG